MPGNPFLAVVERALADAQFLQDLLQRPVEALAAAGFTLAEADATSICEAAAASRGAPGGFAGALVVLARRPGA